MQRIIQITDDGVTLDGTDTVIISFRDRTLVSVNRKDSNEKEQPCKVSVCNFTLHTIKNSLCGRLKFCWLLLTKNF